MHISAPVDVICNAPLPSNPSYVFLKERWPEGSEVSRKIMASACLSSSKRAIFIELLHGEIEYSADLRGGVKVFLLRTNC